MTAIESIHHCIEKQAFPNRSEALKHLYGYMLTSEKLWTHKRIYPCKIGNHYHIGRGYNPINLEN